MSRKVNVTTAAYYTKSPFAREGESERVVQRESMWVFDGWVGTLPDRIDLCDWIWRAPSLTLSLSLSLLDSDMLFAPLYTEPVQSVVVAVVVVYSALWCVCVDRFPFLVGGRRRLSSSSGWMHTRAWFEMQGWSLSLSLLRHQSSIHEKEEYQKERRSCSQDLSTFSFFKQLLLPATCVCVCVESHPDFFFLLLFPNSFSLPPPFFSPTIHS